jgi:hypothetical protein
VPTLQFLVKQIGAGFILGNACLSGISHIICLSAPQTPQTATPQTAFVGIVTTIKHTKIKPVRLPKNGKDMRA